MEIRTRMEAALAGDLHYYTGKVCKVGHLAERQTLNGNCMECSRIKQRTQYNKTHKDKIKLLIKVARKEKENESII
jgi:hypothetical protein